MISPLFFLKGMICVSMSIVTSSDAIIPSLPQPLAVTIGNFDGVHRGHRALLAQARSCVGPFGSVVAVTFRNHPSHVLRPSSPTLLLNTLAHRFTLLESAGVDCTLLLPFNAEMAAQTAEGFIQRLHAACPFSHFIMGYDAALGRGREGNRAAMQEIAHAIGFQLDYHPGVIHHGLPISSSHLRLLLQQGAIADMAPLLGRPYSIGGIVIPGAGRGTPLGFPTANVDVTGLVLPPYGVYAVEVVWNTHHFWGVANIGTAPTLSSDRPPLLEVHLLEFTGNLYGAYIEVVFHRFIRSERSFPHLAALKEQISSDVEEAKHSLHTQSLKM